MSYPLAMDKAPHIFSFDKTGLAAHLKQAGLQAFRAKQLWRQVYVRGNLDINTMTDFSLQDREKLAEIIDFSPPQVSVEQRAKDGVIKWLLKLHDGHEVEAVFIPEENDGYWRGTLCVSSQIGCTLSCRFCHTGTQALARNLTADEIIAQVYNARTVLGDWANEKRKLTNIVFMGMGEPLYNIDNVSAAVETLMDADGIALGSRKITISTSGMVDNLPRIGELGVNLAVSLHAPNNDTRTQIMPINNKWPLEKLMAAIRAFPLKERRRVTWEYVMLDGMNDSVQHAKELKRLIEGIPSLVNIIPFNEWPGSPFKCSQPETIEAFAEVLRKAGISVTVRKTRGEDILAACGQLRTESGKKNTISLQYPSVVAQYGSEQQKQKLKVRIDEPVA